LGNNVKLVLFGIAAWLLPFVASIFFFDFQTHKLVIDWYLFHSIMVVFGSAVGAFLLVKFYEGVRTDYVAWGVKAGAAWLAINWVLDILILVPMMGSDLAGYFSQIGLGYIVMPVMAVSMAAAIENARKRIN
jgi:uncharacterized membrane protein YpjA